MIYWLPIEMMILGPQPIRGPHKGCVVDFLLVDARCSAGLVINIEAIIFAHHLVILGLIVLGLLGLILWLLLLLLLASRLAERCPASYSIGCSVKSSCSAIICRLL